MKNRRDFNVKIDAHQFAMRLITGVCPKEAETDEKYIKRVLTLYLESFFLINEFNNMESAQFEHMKKRDMSDLIGRLISARLN
jgi:hypothetical protein